MRPLRQIWQNATSYALVFRHEIISVMARLLWRPITPRRPAARYFCFLWRIAAKFSELKQGKQIGCGHNFVRGGGWSRNLDYNERAQWRVVRSFATNIIALQARKWLGNRGGAPKTTCC